MSPPNILGGNLAPYKISPPNGYRAQRCGRHGCRRSVQALAHVPYRVSKIPRQWGRACWIWYQVSKIPRPSGRASQALICDQLEWAEGTIFTANFYQKQKIPFSLFPEKRPFEIVIGLQNEILFGHSSRFFSNELEQRVFWLSLSIPFCNPIDHFESHLFGNGLYVMCVYYMCILYMYIYIYQYTCICMYTHTYIDICIYIFICIFIYMYTYIYIYIYICMYVYIYKYIHICIHTCTRT